MSELLDAAAGWPDSRDLQAFVPARPKTSRVCGGVTLGQRCQLAASIALRAVMLKQIACKSSGSD